MSGIHETNSSFQFDKLLLSSPKLIAGGNHFIKYSISNSSLYIEPPKCAIKGSISKTTKRSYCDLIFSNQDIEFITWMENLETHTCKQIFENRAKWFETDMEFSDIENYFASPMKSYKSGNNYLVRTNIPTRLGKINLKIYNENEEEIDPETITEDTNVVTVLEVQGIKCSARSFQIEFEVKQMLQIAPVNMFDKCILLKKNISNIDTIPIPLDDNNNRENITLDRDVLKDSGTDDFTNETDIIADDEDSIEKDPSNSPNNESVDDENCEQTMKTESNDQKYLEASSEMPDIRATANIQETNIFSDLTEFDMNLDDIEKSDQIQIRARNDIYYELYKEARKKARISRNLALQSYLEAKEIKTKYDLDDIESDEDDHFFTSALQSEESQ
jgi:hypothetical protein